MNNFRTEVKLSAGDFSVAYGNKIMSIGSCFSENIGRKFKERKFDIAINPFGQQYNPCSIAKALQWLYEEKDFQSDELVEHDELFHSFAHHGSFSCSTAEETLFKINSSRRLNSEFLRATHILFLTFGTATAFRLKSSGEIVSNCHKLPADQFEEVLLSPAEMVAAIQTQLEKLWQMNPGLKVVLTVSPVRYLAHGAFHNSISKAHLFTAVQQLITAHRNLHYLPAYELVMDDLRDYRFFADDMLHPNALAIDYIWQKMNAAYFEKSTLAIMEKVEEVLKALNHRPRNPATQGYQTFVEKNLQAMTDLQYRFGLDFAEEIALLTARLTAH